MKNELRAKILEMTLAAFGASACASTQVADPAKVPSAAEVNQQTPASHGEASCSAAGCGAKADGTAPGDAKAKGAPAAPASDAKDVASAAAIAAPATTPATAGTDPAQNPAPTSAVPAKASPAKAKPAASKPRAGKKKAADDEGCGAGSCASAK